MITRYDHLLEALGRQSRSLDSPAQEENHLLEAQFGIALPQA